MAAQPCHERGELAFMLDLVGALTRLPLPGVARCRIPDDLAPLVDVGVEDDPRAAGTTRDAIEALWQKFCALYRTGVHPGMQLCVRRHGAVALDRAIGHARGNAPDDPADAERVPMTTRTPVNLFSAAKAVTAMLIHKLDEEHRLHLDDRVSEYIPEFAAHGKKRITLRHIVSHKAGIPNLPREAFDLDLLERPEHMLEILCALRPRARPGQLLAYHAVSGGFVLAEVARRATGRTLRELLAEKFRDPLRLEWLHYGVDPQDVPRVARNALTGPPLVPPISTLLRNAMGLSLAEVVRLSNDPRFLAAVIPSANLISTARDVAAFYQCLLDGGELDGVRVLRPRTIQHAIDGQTGLEIDLTLLLPITYSMGFMLGTPWLSLYGWNHPRAFGHLGISNIFCWADPDRDLAVAFLTTGKPVISLHALRLVQCLSALHETFPKAPRRR
jgi:CubicO group peptidase (beta-lactamase class C family)